MFVFEMDNDATLWFHNLKEHIILKGRELTLKTAIKMSLKVKLLVLQKFSYFDSNLLHNKSVIAILSLKVKLSLILMATKVKFDCISLVQSKILY